MRIDYFGKTKENNERIGQISYKEKEEKLIEQLCKQLTEHGYKHDCFGFSGECELWIYVDDREDFDDVKNDIYLPLKKSFKK